MIVFVTTFSHKLAQLSYQMKYAKVTVNNVSCLLPALLAFILPSSSLVICPLSYEYAHIDAVKKQ